MRHHRPHPRAFVLFRNNLAFAAELFRARSHIRQAISMLGAGRIKSLPRVGNFDNEVFAVGFKLDGNTRAAGIFHHVVQSFL